MTVYADLKTCAAFRAVARRYVSVLQFKDGTCQRKTITGFSLYGRLFSREGTPYVRVCIQSDLERRTRVLRPRHGGEELHRYRLRIKGRRFQIRLEAQPGTGFCFTGGLEMEVEL